MSKIDRDVLRNAIHSNIESLCHHFYPGGKRVRNQWVIGNCNGDEGKSMKIDLAGEHISEYYDFAANEGGDFIQAIEQLQNCAFVPAARAIALVLGINIEDPDYTSPRGQGNRYRTRSSTAPCNWELDYAIDTADITEIAIWRVLTESFCQWLASEKYIGRDKRGNWAFPVRDENGAIVAAHIRIDSGQWQYAPKLRDAGIALTALTIGDPAAAKKVFVGESHWDVLAILDKLGVHFGESVAGISTRGAGNAKLVAELNTTAEVYVVPQNDVAGTRWADSMETVLAQPYKVLKVPDNYKDANEWLRNHKDADALAAAINTAATKTPKGATPFIEFHPPSYYTSWEPPHDLVIAGHNHLVRGSVFILGGAPGVGKSRSFVSLAVAGALRAPWFDLETYVNFRTLIIQSENGMFRLQQELKEINEPLLEDCLRICPPPPYGLCFWRDEFRDQLRRYKDDFSPQVVLLDPLNAVARDERLKDYMQAYDVMTETLELTKPDGPVFGIAAHTRKPMPGERANGRALLHTLSGSYLLGARPRCVFIMQHASDDVNETRVVRTCVKNSEGQLGPQSAWERRNGLFIPVKDFDWDKFRNPYGAKPDKSTGTIDDLLDLIPSTGVVTKEDLYNQIASKDISRENARKFVAGLLREQEIFIHKVPRLGSKKPLTGYSKVAPGEAFDPDVDDDGFSESDIEDDPR